MAGNLFSADSPFSKGLTKIGELVIVSLLWFVTSLPVITIGASTTALYYAVVKCLRMGRGYIVKEYFRSWKQNLIKSVIITVILGGIFLLIWSTSTDLSVMLQDMIANGARSVFAKDGGKYYGSYLVFAVLILFMGMMFCYIFPLLSRFDLPLPKLFAVSFVFVIKYIFYSVAMLVILVGMGYFVIRLPLGMMFAPGLWALLCSFLVEKPIKSITPEPEEDEDAWWMRL